MTYDPELVERVARAYDPVGWRWHDAASDDHLAKPVFRENAFSRAQAALGAAWEWRPIETAPKDGKRFLAWFPKNRYEQIFPIAWAKNVYDDGFGWTLDDGESAVLTYDRPTHWMPLLSPPEARDE